ncbi:MAG: branched-chain amino acid ABC transporter substrate-binding protein [Spirochaetales bacterium]|nr:branched-chain amino acid ABC transporter substrate-binding protein [Spirochaetales bacterium]
MKKRVTVIMIIALLATLFFAGCAEKEAEVIKIGVGGAHSGDLASYGLPSVNAAKLVVEEWNAKGGVMGKQIELVVEDDQCKPEVATNTASKLVDEGVVAVQGHICSGATKSALSIYEESSIPIVSPSATNVDLVKSPNFFRTIASDDAQSQMIVDFCLDTLGVTKFAVLHDKGDYGKGLAEFAVEFLKKDSRAEILLFEGITVGAVDYSAVLNKIKESGAEVIIYGGYHPEASKLVGQMKKMKMDIYFISDDGVKDDTFIKVAGEYAEGVYATGPIDTSSNPLYIKATKDHQEKFGEDPGAFFYNAYAATQAILNAIDKAGATDFDSITKALRTYYVETPLGRIKFDEKGDAEGVGFAVYQVQNGVYVSVK